jgi:hypothetical protein
MMHQDGSSMVGTREWDLMVTMDDANRALLDVLVDEEGTQSSFRESMKLSASMDYSPHFIVIAAATTGIPQRQVRKWTRRTLLNSVVP